MKTDAARSERGLDPPVREHLSYNVSGSIFKNLSFKKHKCSRCIHHKNFLSGKVLFSSNIHYITAVLNIYILASFDQQVVYDDTFGFIFLLSVLIDGPSLLSQSRHNCRANNQATQVVLTEKVCRTWAFSTKKGEENLNQSNYYVKAEFEAQRAWAANTLQHMRVWGQIYSSCLTHTHTYIHTELPCESKTFHSAQVQAHPPNRGVCTFIHGPFFGIWQLYNYQSSTCRAFFPTAPHCPRSSALERRGLWFKWLLSTPNPPEAHKSHKGSSEKAGQNSTRQRGSLKSPASPKYHRGDLLTEPFWLVCIDVLWSSAMGPDGWTQLTRRDKRGGQTEDPWSSVNRDRDGHCLTWFITNTARNHFTTFCSLMQLI